MWDVHCDETDDPMSRTCRKLARETQRLACRVGRRLAPDLDAFDGQLLCLEALPLIAESGVPRSRTR
jgi:cytosine deaminase